MKDKTAKTGVHNICHNIQEILNKAPVIVESSSFVQISPIEIPILVYRVNSIVILC